MAKCSECGRYAEVNCSGCRKPVCSDCIRQETIEIMPGHKIFFKGHASCLNQAKRDAQKPGPKPT